MLRQLSRMLLLELTLFNLDSLHVHSADANIAWVIDQINPQCHSGVTLFLFLLLDGAYKPGTGWLLSCQEIGMMNPLDGISALNVPWCALRSKFIGCGELPCIFGKWVSEELLVFHGGPCGWVGD
jgi:hypothetical protein